MFRLGETGWSARVRQWLGPTGLLGPTGPIGPLGLLFIAGSMWLSGAAEVRAAGEHQVPDLRGEQTIRWKKAQIRMRIPITLHVATSSERPAIDTRRLERSVKRSNEALRSFGIELYIARVVLMPEGFTQIRHHRHRRALAEYAPKDGTVHVFLVDTVELGSVFRSDRGVRGLHWRYRGLRRKLRDREYVVIGGDAPSTTLVHEVGHLFGLEHDFGRQNLMCSCREGPQQIFTRSQGVEIRRGATQFVGG